MDELMEVAVRVQKAVSGVFLESGLTLDEKIVVLRTVLGAYEAHMSMSIMLEGYKRAVEAVKGHR